MSHIEYINEESLKKMIERDELKRFIIIDVREKDEYLKEHIKGARLVPLTEIHNIDLSDVKDKPVLFHCRSGGRTKMHIEKLIKTGCTKMYCIDGGIEQWKKCGLPVVKE
jgi:rhodanese-related sulfurtransferase